MRLPRPSLRLRLPRIEKKPKKVVSRFWSDFAGVKNRRELQDELIAIIRSIERGDGVPDAHYRAGVDNSADALLTNKGIMHLHLGGKDSDIIVFLIQYADRVVLLETNSHIHFRTKPEGRNIVALTHAWLANLEGEVADAAALAGEAATESERKEAADLRDRRMASIAAFKAKAGLLESVKALGRGLSDLFCPLDVAERLYLHDRPWRPPPSLRLPRPNPGPTSSPARRSSGTPA